MNAACATDDGCDLSVLPDCEPPTNTARRGKIASLPNLTREELNRRLERGEVASSLLEWLNSLPETQKLLDLRFPGQPITQQNLSFWRLGGYRVWLQHQENRMEIRALHRESYDIEDDSEDIPLTDRLVNKVALVLIRQLEEISQQPPGPAKWKLIIATIREYQNIRRGNHEAGRVHVSMGRWNADRANIEAAQKDKLADDIERNELRLESGLLAFRDHLVAVGKDLEARFAAGEPVFDQLRQMAEDQKVINGKISAWFQAPKGLEGHINYRPGVPTTDLEKRWMRYTIVPKSPFEPAAKPKKTKQAKQETKETKQKQSNPTENQAETAPPPSEDAAS